MRDFDEFMHSVIAGLVGCVAGILFASLYLSALGAYRAEMRWGDLSNIGTFWGGHLTALSILIIGVGLLIQARQLRAQIEAERELARRSNLEWLTTQLPALANNLSAYSFDQSTNPITVEEHSGLKHFAAAVLGRPLQPDDVEMWIDYVALASYLNAANAVKRIEAELGATDSGQNNSPYSFIYHRGVCEYAERTIHDRFELLHHLQQACKDETQVAGLSEMLDQGWIIEENAVQDVHYLSARRLNPDLKRVDVLRASDSNLQKACESLVHEWTVQRR